MRSAHFSRDTGLSPAAADRLANVLEGVAEGHSAFDQIDPDEAIALANDTPFGLASYYFTRDLSRAFRVAERLEAGIVVLNTGTFAMEMAPFGGVKQSGVGREGGQEGIEEFLETKAFHIGGLEL